MPFSPSVLELFPQPALKSTRYPVVLMHGFGALAGFNKAGMMHDLALMLRQHGILAFAPNVIPYQTVANRAALWKELIVRILEQTKSDKVNLICHSMGGLDARYLASELGGHAFVASITTVSSPHGGTYLAQYVLEKPASLQRLFINSMDRLGNSIFPLSPSAAEVALRELTPRYMEDEFNPNIPDHPAIQYWSCSGQAGKGTKEGINPIMRFQNHILYGAEGVNDGIVSVKSGTWHNFLGVFSADHGRQIGLYTKQNGFNLERFYLSLIDLMQDKGF
jgi:triacylglycerol lipase